MGSEVVGVKPTDGGSKVAEMVGTGDEIGSVAEGVSGVIDATGGGVSTSILKVQPEINETSTRRKAKLFFISDLPR
jgi:hypothetical protein